MATSAAERAIGATFVPGDSIDLFIVACGTAAAVVWTETHDRPPSV